VNIESGICGNLRAVFQSLFPGLEVDCKWLVGMDFLPVNRPIETAKMLISLTPRKYASYTSFVAEFSGTVSMTIALADESDVARAIEAYDLVAERFDAWHHDIGEAKKDLSVKDGPLTIFSPVGFMSAGGDFDIDREKKAINFTLDFTLKGRKGQT